VNGTVLTPAGSGSLIEKANFSHQLSLPGNSIRGKDRQTTNMYNDLFMEDLKR